MELNVDSGATNASINSNANSEFNRRGDHRLAKRIVKARKHFQKPYGENETEACNQDNEIIMEDGIKKCKNCANCDNKKDSEIKPKVTVEISMFHDVSESIDDFKTC